MTNFASAPAINPTIIIQMKPIVFSLSVWRQDRREEHCIRRAWAIPRIFAVRGLQPRARRRTAIVARCLTGGRMCPMASRRPGRKRKQRTQLNQLVHQDRKRSDALAGGVEDG